MLKIILGSFVLSASLFAVDLQTEGLEATYKNSKDEEESHKIAQKMDRLEGHYLDIQEGLLDVDWPAYRGETNTMRK